MPYRKIFLAEQRLRKDILRNKDKLEILDRIREYLENIDNEVEFIPKNGVSTFQRLLADLKGAALSEDEQVMIHEIMNKSES